MWRAGCCVMEKYRGTEGEWRCFFADDLLICSLKV